CSRAYDELRARHRLEGAESVARRNFHVVASTADGVRAAVVQFVRAMREKPGLLITPTLDQLRHGDIVGILGEGACKQLAKTKQVAVSGARPMHLATWASIPLSWDGPVLALFPSQKILDKIDGIRSGTDLIVAAWNPSEVGPWVATWS